MFPLKLTYTEEHLASQLKSDGSTSDQFKTSFIKTHNSLGRRDAPKTTTASLIKPKYTCVTCSEPCMNGDRKVHTEKTGHQFCEWSSPFIDGSA